MALTKKISFIIPGIIFLIICGIFIFIFLGQAIDKKEFNQEIIINDKIIKVELASNEAERYQGLSRQGSLCLNCGMLFVFPDYDFRDFAMREMNFPLDIIFLSDDRIINIAENLEPEGKKPVNIYSSIAPANMVLEINGGDAERLNLKIGDRLTINY